MNGGLREEGGLEKAYLVVGGGVDREGGGVGLVVTRSRDSGNVALVRG